MKKYKSEAMGPFVGGYRTYWEICCFCATGCVTSTRIFDSIMVRITEGINIWTNEIFKSPLSVVGVAFLILMTILEFIIIVYSMKSHHG